MERYKEIERSIIKTYRKEIWGKFVKGIQDYQMISEGDKIAVCISGGKDSMLLAKCMQELQRHGKMKFDLEFIVMNPGYNEINRETIIENAKLLNIPITMFETNIFDAVFAVNTGSPCYLCARMRRGHLYNKAKEMGCNKIALGHHFDDVIETILLSMMYGGEIKTMMPKLHSDNFEGLELIRPMYLVREEAVLLWKKFNDLHFLNCACRFTENCSLNDDSSSKRLEMKKLIRELREKSPYIEMNIFKSLENVNLNTVISYHKDGVEHHFLDDYETR